MIGEVLEVSEGRSKGEVTTDEKLRVQAEWMRRMEWEYEKERIGHRNGHYEAWLQVTASAFMFDRWDVNWDADKCRRELVKAGEIEDGKTERGRDAGRKNVRSSMQGLGEVMAAGVKGERHWFREKQGAYEIDLTIDSGAVATIAPSGTIPGEEPRETEASRRKMSYMVANGAAIVNKGEITLRGKAENGTSMNVIAQVSDVTKPLAAVREILKGGNRIVMDEEVSYIENKKTGKKIPIKRDNGMFVVTMTIPKRSNREMERQYAIMAAGDQETFHRQVKHLV